jgi:uncharacterized protein
MKVAVRHLRDGFPKTVHEEYNAKELDLEFVDLVYLESVILNGTVEKFQDTLTFRGHLTSRVEHTCARCLKQIAEPVDQPFELVYDIQGKEEVDTQEDLRETLLLDHPIRFLCREDCPGLCLHCGTDLNEGPCSCKK